MAAQAGYVLTERGKILVQLPDDNPHGFVLADDDQAWDGGLGADAGSWELIADDDPRITVADRERLGWLLEGVRGAYAAGRADALADLLTSEQVAAQLGLSVQRVRALARSRDVGWRIGRDVLFRPEDVEAIRDRRPGRPPLLLPRQPDTTLHAKTISQTLDN